MSEATYVLSGAELAVACLVSAGIGVAVFVVAWHLILSVRENRQAQEYSEIDRSIREHLAMRERSATATPRSFGRRA